MTATRERPFPFFDWCRARLHSHSVSHGLDAGFIDQVAWTPEVPIALKKQDIGFMPFASRTYKKDMFTCPMSGQMTQSGSARGGAVGTITNRIEVYDDRAKLISANMVSKSSNVPSRRGYSNNSRAYSEWKNLPSGAYMLRVQLDAGASC